MSKQEDYLERLINIHGDKYTYDKNTIVEHRKKVTYFCKKHGKKEKKLSHLLSGGGCPNCATEENSKRCKKDIAYFIDKGKQYFGDAHDYSISEYKHSTKKVDVICKKHGKFSILPSNYYKGQTGCRKCIGEKIRNSKLKSREHYLEKLTLIHGDNYDFSNSNLIDTRTHITYNCKQHGEQTAKLNNLLNGMGCAKCSYENYEGYYNKTTIERDKKEYKNTLTNLYLLEIKSEDEIFLKVGISKKVRDRVTNIKKSGYNVEKIITHKSNLYDIFYKEQEILKNFIDQKYRPLVFFNGHTECLHIDLKETLTNLFKELK